VLRLWRREGLKVPQKRRKKRASGTDDHACHLRRAEHKDHVWCWDFVFDFTAGGSTLKWLSIVDEYTRECLALKVDRGITAEDVRLVFAAFGASCSSPVPTIRHPWFIGELRISR